MTTTFRRRGSLSGVQSSPRIMRGPPVTYSRMFDVPLTKRALSGLESQGLAKTLGSLGGNSLGDDAADRAEMRLAKECLRPGEILLSSGVCGPETRIPTNPYASEPGTTSIPLSVTTSQVTRATGTSLAGAEFLLSPKVLIIGAAAAAAIYFLRKK